MPSRHIAAAAICAFALAAVPAAAQSLPGIHISPPDGTAAGPSVAVEVSWSHETALNASSRSITLTNGAGTSNVTSGFTYEARPQVPDGPAAALSRNTLVLAAGINTITAYICGGTGGDCASATSQITYTPPPPPVNNAVPEIILSPHNDFYRDYTAEAGTASYSAPGYVSMGQPRALTLGHSSELADPQLFLQVDVRDPSLTPAALLSIKVRPQGGSTWLTLTNGFTEAFYRGATTVGSVSRLAVQVPLSAFGPGAESGLYKLEVEVTSHWTNVTPAITHAAIKTVKVPVLSRRRSPYGPGWGVQGVQQAFPSADGVLIDEGDGRARYFHVQNGSYVSPPGDESTLTWVAGDSLVRRYPDGTRTVFGPALAGSLPQVRQHLYTASRLGQRVSYTYNGALLQTMTDPAGLQTVLAYAANAAGTMLLSAVTSPGGRQMTVTHDSINTYFYDADGVMGLRQERTTTGRQYNLYPRSHGVWLNRYNVFGTLRQLSTPSITADNATRPISTSYVSPRESMLPVAGKGTAAAPWSRVVPGAPHMRITGPRGDTTRIWSDRLGLPTRVIDPLGRVTDIERDAEGRPTMVAQDGDTTRTSYNGDGTVRSSYDQAHDRLVSYTYQSLGGATFLRRTSQAGQDLEYFRNPLGAVDSIRVENQTVARFTYEPDYQVRTAADAEGHVTEYFYGGNPWRNADSVRTGMPSDRQRSYSTYDAYGRTASTTDPAGRTTTLTYDALDRLLKQAAPGDSVRYEYNDQGLKSVTDAAGKQYGFLHNRLGWLDQESHPGGGKTLYRYDVAGNLTGTTDRWGRVFTSRYDVVGRRTLFVSAENDSTHFDYPSKGVTGVRNGESEETFVHDGAGRLTSQGALIGGHEYQLHSVYEPSGARISLSFMRGNPWAAAWKDSVGYTYDDRGRLGTVVTDIGDFTSVSYNADGLPSSIGFPGGAATISIGYTPRHGMSSVQYNKVALDSVFGGGTRSYDVLDRLTLRTSTNGRRQREHAYDALGRVSGYEDRKEVTVNPPPELCGGSASSEECLPWTEWQTTRLVTYALDVVGNRTGTTTWDSTGVTQNLAVGVQTRNNRYATYGDWTLAYDTVGNLVSRTSGGQQYRYRWNSVGQLTAVVNPAGDSVAYGYNGLGMRVRRTQAGVTTRYLYDGDDLAAEVDASGNPIRTYRYWPGIDQPHSMVPWVNGQKGTVQFYALDLPSSNVRGLFNASSAVTAKYYYGPFGEPRGASGTNQPLRFAARELDATAGLYYVRARWYDAGMGRFISEDPIGLAGGINNYAYAANDPVNLSDPMGLSACPPGIVCLPSVTVRARVNGMRAAFLIDRWSGTRNGDGVTSMSGVAFAASAGWQDGPGNCDKVTSEGCPFVLEPLVVAVQGNLYHRSCRFFACAAVNAHYRRNIYNVSAPSLDAALRPGSGCVLQSDLASQYHRYGPGNENNMKFLCGGGHYESVFRGDTLVTDCRNGGTYNYGVTFPRHFVYDMVPYYFLGNC